VVVELEDEYQDLFLVVDAHSHKRVLVNGIVGCRREARNRMNIDGTCLEEEEDAEDADDVGEEVSVLVSVEPPKR
jgi:hypothetical protein